MLGNFEQTFLKRKATDMIDFIVSIFAEIVGFFIGFWVDHVINKFAARKKSEHLPIKESKTL